MKIYSIAELLVDIPYISKNSICIIKNSLDEVRLGQLNSNMSELIPRITLQFVKEPNSTSFVVPLISGILTLKSLITAIEKYTKRRVSDGFIFYQITNENHFISGAFIKDLKHLRPNITYISEDSKIKLRKKESGIFSFVFSTISSAPSSFSFSLNDSIESFIPEQKPFANIDLKSALAATNKAIPSNENGAPVEENINSQLEAQQTNNSSIPTPLIPPPLPPPPPPPPMNNKNKKIDPNQKKMRPLRWSTIPKHQLQATIWADEKSPLKSNIIKERDLEKLFSISPAKTSPHKGQKVGNRYLKSKNSSLPIKRANNISIVLSRLPGAEEIYETLLFLSYHNPFTIDQLIALKGILPITEEDVSAVKSSDETSTPTKAEEFILYFSKVKRLAEKVNCLIFTHIFEEYFEETKKKVEDILLACTEVQQSKKLAKLLKVILAIGSVLNRDTYLSGTGFRLQSLKNVAETKAKQDRITLINYIAGLIGEHQPELLYFERDELPHCSIAATVPMDSIVQQAKLFVDNLQLIEREVSAIHADIENCPKEGQFADFLVSFLDDSKKSILQLQSDVEKMKSKFLEVGIYFGEDPSAVTVNSSVEFFSIIHQFSQSLLVTLTYFIPFVYKF